MTPVVVPIELRWGDQDPYGHVNNVAVLRILEEARARAFWSPPEPAEPHQVFPPLDPDQPVWALVSDVELKYLRQLPYQREPVIVEMSIPHVGGASFVIDYALKCDAADPAPRVTAKSTLVMVDRISGRPQRLDAGLRRQLLEYRPDSVG